MAVLGRRLRVARERRGLSQEQVGLSAGLAEDSARIRINRYENDRRVPDPETVARIAVALGLPASYFYSEDDKEAELLEIYHSLPRLKKAVGLDLLRALKA